VPARAAIDNPVAADRILADQGVLDGFAHVSAAPRSSPAVADVALAGAAPTTADGRRQTASWSTTPAARPLMIGGRASLLERFIDCGV